MTRPAFLAVRGTRLPQGGYDLQIGRLLKNHNTSNRNPHWSVKARERKAWEAVIRSAVIVAADVRTWAGYQALFPGVTARRMRLTVCRLVPSRRQFIRDRDNLVTCTKELRDALKGLGLIYDDSMTWLDMPDPEQRVSEDGQPWTHIRITPG